MNSKTTKTTSKTRWDFSDAARAHATQVRDDVVAGGFTLDARDVARAYDAGAASQSARIATLEGAYSQTVEALNHRNARCGELAAHTAELNARAGAAEYGRAKALARIAELEGALAAAAARLDEAGFDESAKEARSLLSTKEG